MTDERPSPILVEQRVRNRIIEYLELVASVEAQRAYDAETIAFVPAEVIDQWEDWVHRDPRTHSDHSIVYTPHEVEALKAFHTAWEAAADRLPNPLPSLSECQVLPAWQELRDAASGAAAAFAVRGPLSDETIDRDLRG